MFVNWAKNIRHERAFRYDILNSQFSLFLSFSLADLLICDSSYLISSASASFSAAAIALQCIRIGFGFGNVINEGLTFPCSILDCTRACEQSVFYLLFCLWRWNLREAELMRNRDFLQIVFSICTVHWRATVWKWLTCGSVSIWTPCDQNLKTLISCIMGMTEMWVNFTVNDALSSWSERSTVNKDKNDSESKTIVQSLSKILMFSVFHYF